MIGPSINTLFAGLVEAVNANGAKSLLNVRLKSSATPKDKEEFEQYINEEQAFFIKKLNPDLENPYYTWEGKIVERSSLKDRELPLA